MRNLSVVSIATVTLIFSSAAAYSSANDSPPAQALTSPAIEATPEHTGNHTAPSTLFAYSARSSRLTLIKRRLKAGSTEAGKKKKKKKAKCYPPWETKACPLKPFTK